MGCTPTQPPRQQRCRQHCTATRQARHKRAARAAPGQAARDASADGALRLSYLWLPDVHGDYTKRSKNDEEHSIGGTMTALLIEREETGGGKAPLSASPCPWALENLSSCNDSNDEVGGRCIGGWRAAAGRNRGCCTPSRLQQVGMNALEVLVERATSRGRAIQRVACVEVRHRVCCMGKADAARSSVPASFSDERPF
jgi:hypothetical protein